MLLILSNKLDSTTDIVIHRLKEQHIPFVRWNTEDLLQDHHVTIRIDSGVLNMAILRAEGRVIDLQRDITVIWNRRCGKVEPHSSIHKLAHREFATREASMILSNIWALLASKSWVNNPTQNLLMNNKLQQLILARQIGLQTPPTLLTNNPAEVRRFKQEHGEIAAKPLSAGIIRDRGVEMMLYTLKLTEIDMANLSSIRLCPTMFQAYVPKQIELRITVVGTKVFACAIDSQKSERTKHDWRRYDFDHVPHYSTKIPVELRRQLVKFLQMSGLVFGAFDFIQTPAGEFVFLEVNPNGQWYWIEKLTGLPIADTLVKYFKDIIDERR